MSSNKNETDQREKFQQAYAHVMTCIEGFDSCKRQEDRYLILSHPNHEQEKGFVKMSQELRKESFHDAC